MAFKKLFYENNCCHLCLSHQCFCIVASDLDDLVQVAWRKVDPGSPFANRKK